MARQHLHTTRILSLSNDLPVLFEVADQEDRVRSVLPELDSMVADGLVTLRRWRSSRTARVLTHATD
jgi:uncharacterized protein